ncbi:MAG: DUF262 domain-containing protein [gamma proteobacterium symbiont of Ctena orbiculata]|nr:MAG: DUF262 domain-containing protein [gamma proteobacterium symbiont of Ctena orbiculata]
MANKSKKLADELFPIKEDLDTLDVLDIPPNERKLHTETYDFSISTLHEYLEKNHVYIPRFQRGYVWNRGQASRLIESLVIQCPIPVLYFDQTDDSKFSVIDGNQRLTSIRLFLNDEFSLRGLTTYPELEGMYYSDLDPRIKRHITNRTLRCIAILPDTHPQIKFDVFERLNTGSVPLTPQELRHGIYHGELIDAIERISSNSKWKELTRLKKDVRMKRSELVLRYFAMSNNVQHYFKPLAGFLNKFTEDHQNPEPSVIASWESDFVQAVDTIEVLYQHRAFRPFDRNFIEQRAINAALFDAQMIAVTRIKPDLTGFNARKRRNLLKETALLFEDEVFAKTIGAGTSSKTSVHRRIDIFTDFLKLQFR